ncbi:HD family phosphohydrolase [Ruoffia tabacinasalis]|uniref:HD family phosphohydrolase n=1 Tax=Ruoffia tabacinasalis TaxID=87458 RepID=UPI003F98E884
MNQQLRKLQTVLGTLFIPLIILLMSVLIFFIGFTDVQPEQYNFRINQVAEETVQAPVTIEDTEQTEINMERARSSVPDAYVFQPAILDQQVEQAEEFFNLIYSIRENEYSTVDINEMLEDSVLSDLMGVTSIDSQRAETQSVPFGQLEATEQLVVYNQAILASESDSVEELDESLSVDSITRLLTVNNEDLNQMQQQINDLLASVLSSEIESTDLNQILSDVNQYISELDIDSENKDIINELMQELVVPTVVYSESETEKRRAEAENAVQPSYILQGQIIVQEGHIINQTTYRQLDLLGYLDREANNDLLIAFAAVIIIHAIALVYYVVKEKENALLDIELGTQILGYGLLFTVSFLVLRVLYILQLNGIDYAMLFLPIYVIPMLLRPRTNIRLTLFFMGFFNLLALFISHDGDSMTVTFMITSFYFFSSLISLSYQLLVKNKNSLRYGFLYALVLHAVFAMPIVLMTNVSLVSEISVVILSFVLFNLLIAFGIYFFIEPYWHKLLSSKAPLTLNQLANLTHPLLKSIVEKAPGSYHHSMMVANISANAADAIGADSLLVRIASYYHDIGKVNHPLFFVENLSEGMESPHSMVTAEESAAIIIGHVTEGEKILREYDMPESVIDICMQHHGTTLVRYFYHQAKQTNNHVDEEKFRYPGPKPQSKEAMIIMIADSVEAASRTIKKHTQTAFENLVDNIINGKLAEGQFEECHMTVAELEKVKKSIVHTIASTFHTRVEYPD